MTNARTKSIASAVVVAVAVIIGLTLAMAPLALSQARAIAAAAREGRAGASGPDTSPTLASPQEPQGFSLEGLRPLPIIDPQGPVATAFPDGDGLDDRAKVDEKIDQLMGEVGLGDVADELRGPDVGARVTDAIVNNAGWQGDLPTYPYEYPDLGELIEANLSEDVVKERPELIVDLASLLMLSPDVAGVSEETSTTPPAALAYALLNAARDVQPSCDLQLSLAFLVSIGQHVPYDGVRAEADRASELCEDDPTPLWLLGSFAAGQSTVGEGLVFTKYAPEELTAFSEEAFAKLRQQNPDSPLAWAGAADLWLTLADEAEGLGVMPFQVRQWRRDALAHYEHARTLSSSAGLLPGHARALSALGRSDEAKEIALTLGEMDPDWAPYQALLVDILIRARDFQGVLEARQAAPSRRPMGAGTIAVGDPWGFALRGHHGYAFDLSHLAVGGASVKDLSFFPDYVQEWVGRGCVEEAEIVSLIATGRAEEALGRLQSPDGLYGFGSGLDCAFEETDFPGHSAAYGLTAVAAAEAGESQGLEQAIADTYYGPPPQVLSQHWDARQDFWRWVGDREKASDVVRQWQDEVLNDPWALQRMGELGFLEGDYPKAAEYLERATSKYDELIGLIGETGSEEDWTRALDDGVNVQGPQIHRQLAMLQLGTARDRADEPQGAESAWDEASRIAQPDEETAGTAEGLAVKALGEVGAAALERGDYQSAVEALSAAVREGELLDQTIETSTGEPVIVPGTGPLRGAEHNNLALAASKAGDHALALRSAEAAVQRDPGSPVYRDTVAFTSQRAGGTIAAIQSYRQVLAEDPTSYVSANNLAVLLADQGERSEAVSLLEQAVATKPGYATAWHNLGVVRARDSSPHQFLAGQGALARAAVLDHGFRGAATDLVMDDQVYDSGVDVSRPVDSEWTYASAASEAQRGFAITMLLLVILRIAWALGLDHVGGWVSQKVVDSSSARAERVPWFWRRLRPRWALAVTAIVLAVPAVWGLPVWPGALLLLITGAITITPLAVRFAAARPGEARHFGWTPAVVVGLVGAPIGLSFAPFPALDDAQGSARWAVRWAPSIAAAAVVAVLTSAAGLTELPYLRGSAMVALVLLASILTPAPPFDGSHITGRLRQIGLALGLAALSLAFAMQWI